MFTQGAALQEGTGAAGLGRVSAPLWAKSSGEGEVLSALAASRCCEKDGAGADVGRWLARALPECPPGRSRVPGQRYPPTTGVKWRSELSTK